MSYFLPAAQQPANLRHHLGGVLVLPAGKPFHLRRKAQIKAHPIDGFISLRQADRAPAQAKWLAAGCVAAPFLLGALLGALIAVLACN